jgi:thymidine phosphorylase
MVAVLGGPRNFVETVEKHLPRAPVELAVAAPADGFVRAIETRDVGIAIVMLGGGRTRPQDPVDHAVGITRLLPVGHEVKRGEPLALVHARSDAEAQAAAAQVSAAYAIGERRPSKQKAVIRRISIQG